MWIKTKEELPLPLQKVLITVENHGTQFVLPAWFSSNREWLYLDSKTPITYKIIAWQPFPAPFANTKSKIINKSYDKFDLERGRGARSEGEIFKEILSHVWEEAIKNDKREGRK